MRMMGTIAKHNITLFFKNPFFILLLVGPILINIFCSYLLGGQGQAAIATVAYYESEAHPEMAFIERELREQNLEPLVCDTREDVERLIGEGTAQFGLILTSDIAQSELFISKGSTVEDYGREQIQTILALSKLAGKERVGIQVSSDTGNKSLDVMSGSFGIFVMLFLFTCIKSLDPLVRERESTVYERITLSSIKPYEYVLGHVLGCLAILLVQTLIQCGAMYVIGQNVELNLMQLLLICLVLALVGIAIGIVIYNCVSTSHTYFIVATFVITPLCMLSNCIFPIEFLPQSIQKLSYLSPLRWLMNGYEQMISGGSLLLIGQQLLMALLIAVVICLGGLWWNNYKVVGRSR